MLTEICEWNDFIIFHEENITSCALFRFEVIWHMDGCPLSFAFKSELNSPANVLV